MPTHGSTEGLFHHSGARVTFRCDPGFELRGFRSAICLSDGTWSAVAPQCGKMERLIFFSCLLKNSLGSGKAINVGLAAYFISIHTETRKKPAFHLLSSVPVERVCTLPPKPEHGDHFLVYGPNDVLIALQYLCFQPFELSGASQRTCLPNNTWSGTPPVCTQGQTSYITILNN